MNKLNQKQIAQAIGFLACSLGGLMIWQTVAAAATVMFTPPAGGAPRETKGGSARGDVLCRGLIDRSTQKLVLLTPVNSNRGLTTLERPTFLVYVPPTTAEKALLTLTNDKGQTHYRTLLPVPQKGGILQLTLPENASPLKLNQSYEWGFALLCGGKLRPDSPSVSSTVQRTQLEAKAAAALAGQPLLQQASIYGANGVWYDMIAAIATLKRAQPQDQALTETWNRVLQSVGLETVAAVPLSN